MQAWVASASRQTNETHLLRVQQRAVPIEALHVVRASQSLLNLDLPQVAAAIFSVQLLELRLLLGDQADDLVLQQRRALQQRRRELR